MNFGIIGAGNIGKDHAEAINRMDNASLVSVADIIIENTGYFTEKYNARAYDNYKKMVCNEELDAVIICLPHKLHREAAVFCAENGIHVLLEKPMAVSSKDCRDIISASEKYGIKLMIGHIMHYLPNMILVKKLVDSGELGTLVSIADTRNEFYFRPDRAKWFYDREMSGGGILMNLGAHSIDRILWLTGAKIKSISGKVGYLEKGFGIEGNAQLFICLDNGVTASVTCVGYKVPRCNEVILYFTEGAIKSGPEGVFLSKAGGPYAGVDEMNEEYDPFYLQLSDFMDSILKDTSAAIPGEYGMEVIKAIENVFAADPMKNV